MKTADEINAALDSALQMTFPASDPIAVYMPDPREMAQRQPEAIPEPMHGKPGGEETPTPPTLENLVAITRASVAASLTLWLRYIQLVQRCNEAAATVWRARLVKRSLAGTGSQGDLSPAKQHAAHVHERNLLESWQEMYDAATLHEAIGEMKPFVRGLLEKRIDEFREGLTAARLIDHRSRNAND